jgi:ATP-binding cassette subfamily C (CFTR/MRP) protein 1
VQARKKEKPIPETGSTTPNSLQKAAIFDISARSSPVPLCIELRSASFVWDSSTLTSSSLLPPTPASLKSLSLSIPHGSLVAIVGAVGSGKTALLSALIGELYQISGYAYVNNLNGIAYASQAPWVRNCTIKQNVLFGLPCNQGRYESCIRAAQLERDLTMMPQGDETEVGERGITLSGGQVMT